MCGWKRLASRVPSVARAAREGDEMQIEMQLYDHDHERGNPMRGLRLGLLAVAWRPSGTRRPGPAVNHTRSLIRGPRRGSARLCWCLVVWREPLTALYYVL